MYATKRRQRNFKRARSDGVVAGGVTQGGSVLPVGSLPAIVGSPGSHNLLAGHDPAVSVGIGGPSGPPRMLGGGHHQQTIGGGQGSSTTNSKQPNASSTSSNPSKRHRERLNAELETVASLLPFDQSVLSRLDKLSVLRLAVSFLQAKTHFQKWKNTFPRPRTERSRDDNDDEEEPLFSSQTKSFGLVLAAGASVPDKRPRVLQLRTRRVTRISLSRQCLPSPVPGQYYNGPSGPGYGGLLLGHHNPHHHSHPFLLSPVDRVYASENNIFKALGGFVLILNENGEIYYTSENIETYLGFHQSDILHQPIFDMIHSEDRDDLRQQLTWNYALPPNTSFQDIFTTDGLLYLERGASARFRCLLDNTCGFLRIDIRGKLTVLQGLPACFLAGRSDPTIPVLGLLAVCTPFVPPPCLDGPDTEPFLKTKHSLDFALFSTDAKAKALLEIDEKSLPLSFYSITHNQDTTSLAEAHKEAIKNGASGMLVYRMISQRTGKTYWVQSSCRLFYKNGKPESIGCTHRLLTEVEGETLLEKRASLSSKLLSFDDSLLQSPKLLQSTAALTSNVTPSTNSTSSNQSNNNGSSTSTKGKTKRFRPPTVSTAYRDPNLKNSMSIRNAAAAAALAAAQQFRSTSIDGLTTTGSSNNLQNNPHPTTTALPPYIGGHTPMGHTALLGGSVGKLPVINDSTSNSAAGPNSAATSAWLPTTSSNLINPLGSSPTLSVTNIGHPHHHQQQQQQQQQQYPASSSALHHPIDVQSVTPGSSFFNPSNYPHHPHSASFLSHHQPSSSFPSSSFPSSGPLSQSSAPLTLASDGSLFSASSATSSTLHGSAILPTNHPHGPLSPLSSYHHHHPPYHQSPSVYQPPSTVIYPSGASPTSPPSTMVTTTTMALDQLYGPGATSAVPGEHYQYSHQLLNNNNNTKPASAIPYPAAVTGVGPPTWPSMNFPAPPTPSGTTQGGPGYESVISDRWSSAMLQSSTLMGSGGSNSTLISSTTGMPNGPLIGSTATTSSSASEFMMDSHAAPVGSDVAAATTTGVELASAEMLIGSSGNSATLASSHHHLQDPSSCITSITGASLSFSDTSLSLSNAGVGPAAPTITSSSTGTIRPGGLTAAILLDSTNTTMSTAATNLLQTSLSAAIPPPPPSGLTPLIGGPDAAATTDYSTQNRAITTPIDAPQFSISSSSSIIGMNGGSGLSSNHHHPQYSPNPHATAAAAAAAAAAALMGPTTSEILALGHHPYPHYSHHGMLAIDSPPPPANHYHPYSSSTNHTTGMFAAGANGAMANPNFTSIKTASLGVTPAAESLRAGGGPPPAAASGFGFMSEVTNTLLGQ